MELTDLPETSEKVIRQNARWYLGVLDDVPWLWRAWRERPTAYNLAQLVRHVGNKVVEWPIAALVYPPSAISAGTSRTRTATSTRGCSTWASRRRPSRSRSPSGWAASAPSRWWRRSRPYLPRPVALRRKGFGEKFLSTFRCQTYWLLATRAAWRVLWSIARTGRYEAGKTDRVSRARMATRAPAR